MTTTQSMMASNLTVQDNTENMEMGTSPYPVDDIEFDLEDDVQYADDNSMLDDASASIDPMQPDADVTQPDDHMYDETFDEEVVFEDDNEKVDLDMNAGEHDHVESYDFEIEDNQDTDVHATDNEAERQNEIAETSAEETHELELVDEEDTNTQIHSITELDQYNSGNNDQGEPADPNFSTKDSNDTVAIAPTLQVDVTSEDVETSASAQQSEQIQKFSNFEDVSRSVEADRNELVNSEVYEEPQETAAEAEITNNDTYHRSPTPAELHPVTVDYAGTIYSLFPNHEQNSEVVALLDDPAMALLPINSLLKELHKPVIDYLGHEDEIVLDVHSLGLHICEDSKYAVELTLSQIIDTYMMLSQNQALAHIEPLHCHLSHRTCLRTQMQYLVDSARTGKTYAEIFEEHLGAPEEENTQREELTYDDSADVEATAEDFFEEYHEQALPVVSAENGASVEEDFHVEDDQADDTYRLHEDFQEEDDVEAASPSKDPQSNNELEERLNGIGDAQEELIKDSNLTATRITNGATEDTENKVDIVDEEEAEDLFADEALDNDFVEGGENTAPEVEAMPADTKKAPSADADDFDFDEWDKEAELEDEANANAIANAPTTPSKAQNSKRKAEKNEDDFEIEFTPQAKKTRSA